MIIAGIIAFYLVLLTTYPCLQTACPEDSPFWWKALWSPTLFLFVVVFIKLLIMFWLFWIWKCYLNPGSISTLGLKIFGLELNPTLLNQTTAVEAANGYTLFKDQLEFVGFLNDSLLTYAIASNCELHILESPNKPMAVRESLRDALIHAYASRQRYSNEAAPVSVYVLELNDANIDGLGEQIAAAIRMTDQGLENQVWIDLLDTVGIGLHRAAGDFSTLIVLKGNSDYPISSAEISAASMFFVWLISVAYRDN